MARRAQILVRGARRWFRVRQALALAGCIVCAAPVAAQETPAAAPAAQSTPAQAPVAVTVRVWPHQGYGRIVFDWPQPPTHSISRDGDNLAIGFDAPFTATLDEIPARLDTYATGARAAADGRGLTVALKPGVRFKAYKSDNSLVVDLLPPAKPRAAAATDGNVPRVPVRTGTHVNFNRLVFDWPRDVNYTVGEKGGRTVVAFDRPGNVDVAALRANPPPFVRGVEVFGVGKTPSVVLQLTEGAEVRHFRTGMSVVVDILPPSPGKKTKTVAKKTIKKKQPAPTRPKPDADMPPVARAEVPKVEAAPLPRPVPETPAKAPAAVVPDTSGPVALFDMSGQPVNRLAERAVTPPSSPAVARSAEAAPTSLLSNTAAMQDAVPVVLTLENNRAVLKFHWPEEVGAAVFERAGHLWAVFDRDARFGFEDWDKALAKPSPNSKRRPEEIPAQAFIDRPQASSMPGTSVFRMKIPAGINPQVTRDRASWVVALEREYLKPASGINVESHLAAAAGARLFISQPDAGQAVAISDPEVGDRIWVVPLSKPESGVGLARTYAEVELFATAQGIAGRAISDNIVFRTLPTGIEIAAREGLTLSGVNVDAGRSANGGSETKSLRPGQTRPGWLFDFESWRRASVGSFTENKQALLRAAAMASPTTRNTKRLELAQLFFAHNHLTDVIGLLQVIEQDEPELAQEPVFRALRGAAYYRLGDLERAARDLDHASLDSFKETSLWRAAEAAAREDWVTASRYFARAETVMQAYPVNLQVHFGLLAAEASLNIGDVGLAKFHLDRLVTLGPEATAMARVDYLRGRLLAKVLDPEGALTAWDRAIKGPDRRIRVLASLAKTDLLLEKNKLTRAEAAKQLEKLRFSWRGDGLEFKVLSRLGHAYIDAGDYKNGLMTLKELATNFSDYTGVEKIIDDMRAAFIKLYVDGEADKLPPLTALALYDQFRELTPQGPVGDKLVARLAERLVAVDLLDRAATLLTHLVDERLGGTARIDANNQLALVYLLDRKPNDALDVLAGNVPADLIPQSAATRRHLKARALTELARYKEALELVNGDASVEADRLRAEVYWKLRDWTNAAIAYDRIVKATVPAPGEQKTTDAQSGKGMQTLSADSQQDVLSLAIAHALGRNQDALKDLRMRFLGPMSKTAFKDSFDVITAPSGVIPDDFTIITGKVAEVDRFRAFMKNYRDKLLGRGKPAAAGGAPQAQSGAPAAANG